MSDAASRARTPGNPTVQELPPSSVAPGANAVSSGDASGGYQRPTREDFSAQTWTAGFDSLVAKMEAEYAFTAHKALDWATLRSTFRPRIAEAEAAKDAAAYHRALREFVFSFPDGHVSLSGGDSDELRKAQVAAGLGFAVADLDDGRVVVRELAPGGSAARAGMQLGASIIELDDQPIQAAIEQVSVLWHTGTIATKTMRRLVQLDLLPRAKVGTPASRVTFQNPGATEPRTVTLAYAADDFSTHDPLLQEALDSEPLSHRVLESGHGYLRVPALEVTLKDDYSDASRDQDPTYTGFRKAMEDFVARKVPGIVIDVRGNGGGDDKLTADLGGFFVGEAEHYEHLEAYNTRTRRFEIVPGGDATLRPQAVRYDGPVVVLVSPATISSGEGLPMCIQRRPRGRVVGFHGTNGSFGLDGGGATLPGRYVVGYPFGRSLDRSRAIQLDSDRTGQGGVVPNPRVPWTVENVTARASGRDAALELAIQTLRHL
ncbi:MAG TPA: S41 family peptidase [Myxococcaceae bacterium]|nr:S41 family peptidase [Myxococcaceae bacterium]